MPYQRPRIQRYQYPLANGAYGFPRGQLRRLKPFVLICIHITGNRRTAAMPVGIGPGTGTRAEVAYMARDRNFGTASADYGNSAHDYIARDGSILACIPTKFAAWNNGDVQRPNRKLKSIRRIVDLVAGGRNANEAYVREVECTGSPGSFPLTKEQRESVAFRIAADSIAWKLAISRETVHLHADIDSVDRASCPFPAKTREDAVARIIQRAKAIRAELLQTPGPDPDPDPDPNPEPDPCEELKSQLAAAEGLIDDLRERNRAKARVLADVAELVDPWDPTSGGS